MAAPNHADKAGEVYVFTETSRGWKETAELTGSDTSASDGFGTSVAIAGQTIVVGAEYAAAEVGRAYVFTKTSGGWRQSAELKGAGTVTYDQFGSSVAVAGQTIMVGADFRAARAGRVYVFTKTSRGWRQTAVLKGSDSSTYDEFGYSVAMTDQTLVVGALYHGAEAGSAYVFTKRGKHWVQVAELEGSDTRAFDYFGASVAVSGDTVVVGANDHASGAGRAYVFTKRGGHWVQVAELKGSDTVGGDYFGESVAVSGETVVVGGEYRGNYAGSTYVFTKTSSGWQQTAELEASDTTGHNAFGSGVAFSGDTILVGADGHDADAGCMYVFNI